MEVASRKKESENSKRTGKNLRWLNARVFKIVSQIFIYLRKLELETKSQIEGKLAMRHSQRAKYNRSLYLAALLPTRRVNRRQGQLLGDELLTKCQAMKLPEYKEVRGVPISKSFSTEAFLSGLEYVPQEGDIFIDTFPKCGTTWTQNILMIMARRGKPFEDFDQFLKCTPFLENLGKECIERMPRPGIIKTHLPYSLTPISPSAKYVYVTRNPKDACVSLYHHAKGFANYNFDGTFDDFFELFIQGKADYGDYFDHTLAWYEHRNDPNVFFTSYEELKADTKDIVLKMAKFLDTDWSRLAISDSQVLDNTLKYSSTKEMKKLVKYQESLIKIKENKEDVPEGLKHFAECIPDKLNETQKNFEFVRKGVVGDWKSHMSKEQSKRMDSLMKERLKNTYMLPYWQSLGIL
ncbi:hypothetical protein LAZ67_19002332 [Cordylochernes scorpioides]|uniref:Sulfotransferase domain-containing protein n=1 Tax=Cordylochernes scorpioides TaxID=51811 RepID=A0ABY6LMN1_9ARAC|nr:hypothetical protein LAZ67_19002332 [Cordylochernes scorpioides]